MRGAARRREAVREAALFTSIDSRHSSSCPLARASEIVCSRKGARSPNALRLALSVSAQRNEPTALSAATRMVISCSGRSEAVKTERRVEWCAFIPSVSAKNSESAPKMMSDASCSAGLPLRVPSSMNGSSSGHSPAPPRRPAPSDATHSQSFLRMCRTCSDCTPASSSCFTSCATGADVRAITPAGSPSRAGCVWPITRRSSTAESERICSFAFWRASWISPEKKTSGCCFSWLNASSACERTALSWLMSALTTCSYCASAAGSIIVRGRRGGN